MTLWKGTSKEQQTVLIPVHICALSIPITPTNISHLQMAELEHNKVPVPPDHTRSLSVFLAWRVHKSLAQVHTASCGTFRAITSCSKAPCFCLTYKKAWSSCIYLSFFSKLVHKRCQERHSINGRNFFFQNFELFTQIKATHQNFQDSDLNNREKDKNTKVFMRPQNPILLQQKNYAFTFKPESYTSTHWLKYINKALFARVSYWMVLGNFQDNIQNNSILMYSIQLPLQTTEDEGTLAPSQIQSKTHSKFKKTIFIFWHYDTNHNLVFLCMPILA